MKLYFPKEYKPLLKLGIPISIGQIGLMLQNLCDNIMVGHHSTQELAAAGFVNNLYMLIGLISVGFSIGIVSQVGALYTQNRKSRIVAVFKGSLVADILQGMAMMSILVLLYLCLPFMGQPEELLPLMRPYLLIQIASFPLWFLANPFKQTADSINDTMVSMTITLIGNAWNIFFNWVLIFGKLGFPEMGIVGAAWSTLTSRLLMLVLFVAVFLLRPKYKEYLAYWKMTHARRSDVKMLTRLGWPIALQMGMEVASFSLVVIFIGWLGTNQLAAHQVMNTVSNVVFLTFMGFSNAVSIRVSNYNGLKDMRGVRNASFAGYELVLILSAIMSVLAFTFRHEVAYLFTDNAEVAEIVALCIIPLIAYQIGDGMQCTFLNALRGLGDVEKLMKYSGISYLVISIPLSFVFGIIFKLGTFGVWMGYPFGLSTAAVLFLRRFLKQTEYHGK